MKRHKSENKNLKSARHLSGIALALLILSIIPACCGDHRSIDSLSIKQARLKLETEKAKAKVSLFQTIEGFKSLQHEIQQGTMIQTKIQTSREIIPKVYAIYKKALKEDKQKVEEEISQGLSDVQEIEESAVQALQVVQKALKDLAQSLSVVQEIQESAIQALPVVQKALKDLAQSLSVVQEIQESAIQPLSDLKKVLEKTSTVLSSVQKSAMAGSTVLSDIQKALEQLAQPLSDVENPSKLEYEFNKISTIRTVAQEANYKYLTIKASTQRDLPEIVELETELNTILKAIVQTEKPETEKPETEKPETEKPETEKPETEKPETEKPETEKPETEKPETEKPETEKPETEKPETEKPETEKPGVRYKYIPDPKFRNYLKGKFPAAFMGENVNPNDKSVKKARWMDVHGMNIERLDGIEYFTALQHLDCHDNALKNLDLIKNTALTYLSCSTNQLDRLDLIANKHLRTLWCTDNRLTQLDLRQNTALEVLGCNGNQLEKLNLSQSARLKQLWCQRNKLIDLDITGFRIKPSHSTKNEFQIYYGNYEGEQHLQTLKVNEALQDDYEINQVKTSSPGAVVKTYDDRGNEKCSDYDFSADYDTDPDAVGKCRGQLKYIEDSNFRKYLQAHFKRAFSIRGRVKDQIDSDDPRVKAATELDVSKRQIKSLKGIEYFKALQSLDCHQNYLKTLDMSGNPQLKELNCYDNQLGYLDVSKNTALQVLDCQINHLTQLDLSQNTELKQLWCYQNELTYLDATGFRFKFPDNHAQRFRFEIYYGDQVQGGRLKNLKIQDFLKNYKEIKEIKTKTPKTRISTFDNNNRAVCYDYNPTIGNGVCKDSWREVEIPDDNFRNYLKGRFPDAFDGELMNSNDQDIKAVTKIDVHGKDIVSLKGIEYFPALKSLDCDQNKLTSLDVSQNKGLKFLSCSSNQLAQLDVRKNAALQVLDCQINHLTQLDLSQNTELKQLWCYQNELTYLDATGFRYTYNDDDYSQHDKPLEIYYYDHIQDRKLQTLKINKALRDYGEIKEVKTKTPGVCIKVYDDSHNEFCSNYSFQSYRYGPDRERDYDKAPLGNCISALVSVPDYYFRAELKERVFHDPTVFWGNSLDSTRTGGITKLDLYISSTRSLKGIEAFTELQALSCHQRNLLSLDVSQNKKLKILHTKCPYLKSLDVSKNKQLLALWCFGGSLGQLDVGANENLVSLVCDHNSLKTLDVSNNRHLVQLWCNDNPLTKLDATGLYKGDSNDRKKWSELTKLSEDLLDGEKYRRLRIYSNSKEGGITKVKTLRKLMINKDFKDHDEIKRVKRNSPLCKTSVFLSNGNPYCLDYNPLNQGCDQH